MSPPAVVARSDSLRQPRLTLIKLAGVQDNASTTARRGGEARRINARNEALVQLISQKDFPLLGERSDYKYQFFRPSCGAK